MGTSETIGKAYDAMQLVKAWFGAIACLIVGGLVFVGPQGIAEELPWHRELGVGIGVFGVLFLLALSLRGRAGARAKSLLAAVALGLLAGGSGFVAFGEGRIVWELSQRGELVQATVERSPMRMRHGVMSYDSDLRAADGRRLELKDSGQLRVGARMQLLVHPEHGDWLAAVGEGADVVEIAEAREKTWFILGFGAAAVLFALFALGSLWGFVRGPQAPRE